MGSDSGYSIAGVPVGSDDAVLDLGTKDGSELTGCPGTVVGIDIDDSRYPEQTDTRLLLGDGRQLPFKSDTFDFVNCTVVLEHVNGSKELIAEAARVLKPTGTAYFTFPNRISILQPHREVPRYYSVLPKTVGKRLAPYVLSDDQIEYYEKALFPLTPITARRHLHSQFDTVEYTIRISGEMVTENRTVQKMFEATNQIATKPPFKWPYELLWPNAAYRCSFQ